MSSFRRSTVLFVLHTWGTSQCLTFGLALFCSKTALSQWYFSSEAAASDISKLWITLGWICWIYCSREMGRVGWPPQLPTVPPGPQVENGSTPMTNDHPYLILLASFIIYAWWTSTGAAAVLYGTSFIAPTSGPSGHLRDRASQCRSYRSIGMPGTEPTKLAKWLLCRHQGSIHWFGCGLEFHWSGAGHSFTDGRLITIAAHHPSVKD